MRTTRLPAQVAILPDFDQVFRAVRRAITIIGTRDHARPD